MKKIVVQFLNKDGSEFQDKAEIIYAGPPAERYEAFWVIDEAIAQLSLLQYKFPRGGKDVIGDR